jgi:hypothetical protein
MGDSQDDASRFQMSHYKVMASLSVHEKRVLRDKIGLSIPPPDYVIHSFLISRVNPLHDKL